MLPSQTSIPKTSVSLRCSLRSPTAILRSAGSLPKKSQVCQQVRTLRFGAWSSYLDPNFQREMRHRQQAEKHKYIVALHRTLSWDRHFPDKPRSTGFKGFMCSAWRAQDWRPRDPWTDANELKGSNNTEAQKEFEKWHARFHDERRANETSQPDLIQPHRRRFSASGSTYASEMDNFNDAAYDIDPITNRKVFKNTSSDEPNDTPSKIVRKPVKTFKGYRSQFSSFAPPTLEPRDKTYDLLSALAEQNDIRHERDAHISRTLHNNSNTVIEKDLTAPCPVQESLKIYDEKCKNQSGRFYDLARAEIDYSDPVQKSLKHYDEKLCNINAKQDHDTFQHGVGAYHSKAQYRTVGLGSHQNSRDARTDAIGPDAVEEFKPVPQPGLAAYDEKADYYTARLESHQNSRDPRADAVGPDPVQEAIEEYKPFLQPGLAGYDSKAGYRPARLEPHQNSRGGVRRTDCADKQPGPVQEVIEEFKSKLAKEDKEDLNPVVKAIEEYYAKAPQIDPVIEAIEEYKATLESHKEVDPVLKALDEYRSQSARPNVEELDPVLEAIREYKSEIAGAKKEHIDPVEKAIRKCFSRSIQTSMERLSPVKQAVQVYKSKLPRPKKERLDPVEQAIQEYQSKLTSSKEFKVHSVGLASGQADSKPDLPGQQKKPDPVEEAIQEYQSKLFQSKEPTQDNFVEPASQVYQPKSNQAGQEQKPGPIEAAFLENHTKCAQSSEKPDPTVENLQDNYASAKPIGSPKDRPSINGSRFSPDSHANFSRRVLLQRCQLKNIENVLRDYKQSETVASTKPIDPILTTIRGYEAAISLPCASSSNSAKEQEDPISKTIREYKALITRKAAQKEPGDSAELDPLLKAIEEYQVHVKNGRSLYDETSQDDPVAVGLDKYDSSVRHYSRALPTDTSGKGSEGVHSSVCKGADDAKSAKSWAQAKMLRVLSINDGAKVSMIRTPGSTTSRYEKAPPDRQSEFPYCARETKDSEFENLAKRRELEEDFKKVQTANDISPDESAAVEKVKTSQKLSPQVAPSDRAKPHTVESHAGLNEVDRRKMSGNYGRDFPDLFEAKWTQEDASGSLIRKANTTQDERSMANHDAFVDGLAPKQAFARNPDTPRLETSLDRKSSRNIKNHKLKHAKADIAALQQGESDLSASVSSYGAEQSAVLEDLETHNVRFESQKAKLVEKQKAKELTHEVRSIYEESCGTIDTRHRQVPEPALSQLNSSEDLNAVKPMPDTAEPTVYKILAYDPIMQSISTAETTSIVTDSSSPLNPADVLLRLSNPAKFFPHFQPLESQGYEIVSGSGDVLVFRKVRSRASSPTKPSQSTDHSDHKRLTTNPIDGMQSRPVAATGDFASPTGFVNLDIPRGSDAPFKSNVGVRREESVFSGKRNWDDDAESSQNKGSKAKKVVMGAVWVAALSYSIGVVADFFKTGGTEGRGPESF